MGWAFLSFGFGLAFKSNIHYLNIFNDFGVFDDYIIIMKHFTFIVALMLFSAPQFSDAKFCSIAPPENYTLCEYDSQGECCLIEYEEDGQDCIEVVCTSWDQCVWEPALKKQCG